MLRPKIIYPGQVDVTDLVGFPDGKAQNDIVEGDGFGTPYEKLLLNDTLGFHQALLRAANLTPNDTQEKVGASQLVSAIRVLADNSQARYSVTFYGADPSGGTDSAAALQAAINAALANGGGFVILPPGAYKVNSGLTLPNGVSLVGTPGATTIQLNHASANLFTAAAGPYSGNPQIISGINFEGAISASGRVLFDAGTNVRAWHISDCSYNAGSLNLKGQFFRCDGNASSVFVFDNVNGRIPTGGSGIVSLVNGGKLLMRGGSVSVPATWAGDCISLVGAVKAHIENFYFDGSAYSTGGGTLIHPGSGSYISIDGCVFDGGSGSGIVPISFSSNALVNMTDSNQFLACLPYDATSIMAGAGSRLQLLPTKRDDISAGTSIALEVGYQSYLVSCTANPAATLTLPPGRYPGQPMQLTYYNAGSGTVQPAFAGAGLTGFAVPSTVGPGNTLTGNFVWEDMVGAGNYRWVQQGTWGVGLQIVP